MTNSVTNPPQNGPIQATSSIIQTNMAPQKNFSLPPLIKRIPSAQRAVNGVPHIKDGKLQAQADFQAVNEQILKRKESELKKLRDAASLKR